MQSRQLELDAIQTKFSSLVNQLDFKITAQDQIDIEFNAILEQLRNLSLEMWRHRNFLQYAYDEYTQNENSIIKQTRVIEQIVDINRYTEYVSNSDINIIRELPEELVLLYSSPALQPLFPKLSVYHLKPLLTVYEGEGDMLFFRTPDSSE